MPNMLFVLAANTRQTFQKIIRLYTYIVGEWTYEMKRFIEPIKCFYYENLKIPSEAKEAPDEDIVWGLIVVIIDDNIQLGRLEQTQQRV